MTTQARKVRKHDDSARSAVREGDRSNRLHLALIVIGGTIGFSNWRLSGFDFFTVERVRHIFLHDGAVAFGWFHYLAVDLFTGLWISRDADKRGFRRVVQAPILGLTFLAAPAGLLLWFIVRKLSRIS